MQTRTGIILLLALVFGGVAAYLAIDYIGGQDQTAETPEEDREMVQVAVAATDLDAGHVLVPDDVDLVEWPADATPPNYVNDRADVVGRGLLAPVTANEPLLPAKLASSEAGGGLPIVIPEGKRAVTISVDQVIGVAGFVLPGTRVDVLVTMNRVQGQEESESKVVLQNLEVLSAGQSYQRNVGGEPMTASVVTLLVTPEQAETLILATTEGIVQLALRNPLDMNTVETDGATPRAVLQRDRTRPVARQPVRTRPSGLEVEIYRGPDRSVTQVDTTGGGR
jgi:pilus assembly protein CpaB